MKPISDAAQSTAQTIATLSGSATASTGVIHFINENSGFLGICFTGATFLVYLGSVIYDRVERAKLRQKEGK